MMGGGRRGCDGDGASVTETACRLRTGCGARGFPSGGNVCRSGVPKRELFPANPPKTAGPSDRTLSWARDAAWTILLPFGDTRRAHTSGHRGPSVRRTTVRNENCYIRTIDVRHDLFTTMNVRTVRGRID